MQMDDKELQEIKKDFEWGKKMCGRGHVNLDDEQIEWLISTIEGLRQEVNKYCTALE